ncbi:hypothetical protein OMP40_21085 [Cohnella rhizosphaerae]|uniref:Uncharacterized protein n=1 Tax=Cohnella rhizosphaerae TaxID=1457232 RepID=A0A9X4L155_9BACL|nr:hypothetical protein [Cohnella rhizosphaerae]
MTVWPSARFTGDASARAAGMPAGSIDRSRLATSASSIWVLPIGLFIG